MASKRNLVILLVMPFVVGLLSFNALRATFNLIENDIIAIDWEYNDNEMFVYSTDPHKHLLKATALNDDNYPAISSLIWNVNNVNSAEDDHADILVEGEKSYLKTLSPGEVTISVCNVKGNIQKTMKATIYENSMIIFNSRVKGSQSNIDSSVYYGQYDLVNNTKKLSGIPFETKAVLEGNEVVGEIKSSSDNITFDNDAKMISFKENLSQKVEDAYVDLGYKNTLGGETYRYNFKIVKDSINVYNYQDLLNCTNKSENGEIVVLRKNLESSSNLEKMDKANTEQFGTSRANFKNEIYTFETRFNRKYIDLWNNFVKTDDRYQPISSQINVGVRVQKDFYGNGFTINMHDLAYPYDTIEMTDQTGKSQLVPQLNAENLFRGPLTYYSLGDPNGTPLARAYGQDNIGMYVEGDNITINDVRLKNCDFGNNLYNLDKTGTVLEVYGDNVTIKNSILSSGKTILRAYDSNNFLLENSMLSYSRNFLLSTGSYDYLEVDENRINEFYNINGTKKDATLKNYLSVGADGDNSLMDYTMGSSISNNHLKSLRSIQKGLDNNSTASMYHGDLTIKDSLFYQSGITSIALESLFNGSFLYNASPNKVTSVLSNHSSEFEEHSIGVPFFPTGIGGTSYPVKLTLKGSTKFYDYKNKDLLDLNGLVESNMSSVASIFTTTEDLTLDKIFPIKEILLEEANKLDAVYEGTVNSPIAYYGGGLNFSEVIFDSDFAFKDHLLDTLDVDFLAKYAEEGVLSSDLLVRVLTKCVTLVSGFNPFKFVIASGDGYLYGETPKVQTLIDNNK